MKQETKDRLRFKARRAKEVVAEGLPWLIPLFGILGYLGAIKNHNDICRLEGEIKEAGNIINNNAQCQMDDRSRLNDLERQNNLLMERALLFTGEGKEAAE